jgi:hypothetical protein
MRIFTALVVGGLAISMTAGAAAAQPQGGTGTVTGRLMLCKMLPRPMGGGFEFEPPIGLSVDIGVAGMELGPGVSFEEKLVPVAPEEIVALNVGPRRIRAFATYPAVDVEVTVEGLSLNARTDAEGTFMLQGVPAGQAMTVGARLSPDADFVLPLQEVVLSSGQALDLGVLGLSGCAAAMLNSADDASAGALEHGAPALIQPSQELVDTNAFAE